MKLAILEKALEQFIVNEATNRDDRLEAIHALVECKQSMERQTDDDLWKNTYTVISQSTLIDILNQLTYDIYGELARRANGNAPFESYAYKCRASISSACEQFTNEQLRAGYDFCKDLWHDNEAMQQNNWDGTFKK